MKQVGVPEDLAIPENIKLISGEIVINPE